ncbi:FUSC family protein [Flavihumibacter solisilvae]|uniref:Integral membrane bound transporter domain-containing protein n=1 Tax=Flavihumibacter solisilvae TaxID=1349421 RepID=A0A0C1L0G9_9BACT|nr:FUSC family protein [Flavihumibacter solisilvae]KIC93021.1 hypothetical protein OI18_19930 [Flavihumibacter solisilvae]
MNKSPAWAKLLDSLFEVRQTERLWHIPLLASLCAGIPLAAGLYFGQLRYGILASTAALVILYLPASTVAHRMITMLACSFGILVCFTTGIIFSFNEIVSSIVFGVLSFAIQWVANYFRMKPPGSFFFIMIAAIASCNPFDAATIPAKVGIVGMGTMLACVLAFTYSLYIVRRIPAGTEVIQIKRKPYHNTVESAIMGVFMGLSLVIAHLLKWQNPYWVPISCLAVLQGVSLHHVWQRSLHRILGTFVGLGITWLILHLPITPLFICISIFVLQFMVEMLIVRHYGLAVVFITPLTIFLAEAGSAMTTDPNVLIPARMLEIAVGSVIGAFAGWFIHHEQLRERAARHLRKTRVMIMKK